MLLQYLKLKKRFAKIFHGGKAQDLEGVFAEQVKLSREMREEIDNLLVDSQDLRKMAESSIQHVGLVRYNPFKETGGDQSFSLALLDSQGGGVVVSSLHTREETRVYSKPIKEGKCSEYQLTNEEEQAIGNALSNSKGFSK